MEVRNLMKNLLKKAGYVSIELVIVAGIVLVVGMVAVTAFTSKAGSASDSANTKINDAFTEAGIEMA